MQTGVPCRLNCLHLRMAMGQRPNRTPSEHFYPTTKIGSEMGGAQKAPKWDPKTVLTHSHISRLGLPTIGKLSCCCYLAVGQLQWYHFGVGAPPILVYFSGDWDVHWVYGLLTHGHLAGS